MVGVGKIALYWCHLVTDCRDGLVQLGLPPAGDEDVAALGDEPLRCRQADPAAATGDQRDLAVKSHRAPPLRRSGSVCSSWWVSFVGVRCAYAGCLRQDTAGSRTAPSAGADSSPRVFVARSAMTAAAARKMLQARSARWNPEVRASARATWATSRWLVRDVATAEKIASPSAPPSCCEVLTSAAASPALSGGTPAFAAV